MLGRLLIADLKIIVRNRQALFWSLAFPVIFAVIFGLFNFDRLPDVEVGVVSRSAEGNAIVVGLKQIEGFVIDPAIRDEAQARAAVREGDLDYALLVNDDGVVTLLLNSSASDQNRIFVPVFERVLDEVNIRIAGVERRFRLNPASVAGRSGRYYDFVMPGIVGMGVMSYGIIGLASTVATYRAQRILRRILATPLKPRMFLAALVLAHLVLAVVQSLIVLAVGRFLFDGVVRGNVLWVLLLVMLGNLTFLNLGFIVASRAQSAEAASGLGNAMTMPMMFFSGVFFPTTTLPWILPTITALLPLSPLVKAIRKVTLDGQSIGALGSEIGQLAAWAIVTFLIASRVFRFERA